MALPLRAHRPRLRGIGRRIILEAQPTDQDPLLVGRLAMPARARTIDSREEVRS